jgi:transcriptional regulator GlxA family with amidase domain
MTDAPKPLSVALLALPESTPMALYGLHEVFASVGVAWAAATGEPPGIPAFHVQIVSLDGQPYMSPAGSQIVPHCTLEDATGSDIVIVTDLMLNPNADPRGQWPDETEWLRAEYERGAFLCAVCTGSLMVAGTGLLDGRTATTNWSAVVLFAQYFPLVALQPARILAPAGPGHRIVTSGGASSWEELVLHLIARFCGQKEAIRMAKLFVFGDRSDGQLPFAAMGPARRHDDAVIAGCQEWIAQHYDGGNPVEAMTDRADLAERTFKRRVKAAAGQTPVAYVQALRIEEAKQMLETTAEPTDSIGHAVGYEDPSSFRRLFKRQTGITPARYRQKFQTLGLQLD